MSTGLINRLFAKYCQGLLYFIDYRNLLSKPIKERLYKIIKILIMCTLQ